MLSQEEVERFLKNLMNRVDALEIQVKNLTPNMKPQQEAVRKPEPESKRPPSRKGKGAQ